MNKYFEALERLAMPYELHISECKKLGIGLTEDYETIQQALLKSEKEHNALEIIKGTFMWAEDNPNTIYVGRINDIETMLTEEGFEDEEQFNLLKEVL